MIDACNTAIETIFNNPVSFGVVFDELERYEDVGYILKPYLNDVGLSFSFNPDTRTFRIAISNRETFFTKSSGSMILENDNVNYGKMLFIKAFDDIMALSVSPEGKIGIFGFSKKTEMGLAKDLMLNCMTFAYVPHMVNVDSFETIEETVIDVFQCKNHAAIDKGPITFTYNERTSESTEAAA